MAYGELDTLLRFASTLPNKVKLLFRLLTDDDKLGVGLPDDKSRGHMWVMDDYFA